jgi:hypothetical protein
MVMVKESTGGERGEFGQIWQRGNGRRLKVEGYRLKGPDI